MTRTVNGERLFETREKEVLRKMLWQVADFSGVEVLTYALMGNHFHVLVRIPESGVVTDRELMRRWRVLYPKPTKYQAASLSQIKRALERNDDEAAAIRKRLRARMEDVSAFMQTLKQRFTLWFNKSHGRFGTLWAERFKSVLVEGSGNPLQTMAAYIDLNAVRAGLVNDPKDYRFCGYGEAVSGSERAREGLCRVWADRIGASTKTKGSEDDGYAGPIALEAALQAHRRLLFAKGWNDESVDQAEALKVLEKQDGVLPKAVVLRCRVRYFTDGAVLGSREFVERFLTTWQQERGRKRPPKANRLRGADWGDLTVIRSLQRHIFG